MPEEREKANLQEIVTCDCRSTVVEEQTLLAEMAFLRRARLSDRLGHRRCARRRLGALAPRRGPAAARGGRRGGARQPAQHLALETIPRSAREP